MFLLRPVKRKLKKDAIQVFSGEPSPAAWLKKIHKKKNLLKISGKSK